MAPKLTQDPQFGHSQNELPGCSACGWRRAGPERKGMSSVKPAARSRPRCRFHVYPHV